MTNESAVLGLLADLYRDRSVLQAENAALRRELEEMRANADHARPESG